MAACVCDMFENPQTLRFYFPSTFSDWMWPCRKFWNDGGITEIKLQYIREPHPTGNTVVSVMIWTTWCPAANQNGTALMINVPLVDRASSRGACCLTFLWKLPNTEHVFCPAVVLTARRSVKLSSLKSGTWCFVVAIHRPKCLFYKLEKNW